MKVTKKEQQPEFKPVTIEITFETLREYQLFKQWIGASNMSDVIAIANSSKQIGSIKNFDVSNEIDLVYDIYSVFNT